MFHVAEMNEEKQFRSPLIKRLFKVKRRVQMTLYVSVVIISKTGFCDVWNHT